MYLLMNNIVEHIKYGVIYVILSPPAYSPMVPPLYHRLYQVQNRNVCSKCTSSLSLFSLVPPPWVPGYRGGVQGGDMLGLGHSQQTIQSPDTLHKAPTYYTKT